MALRNLLSSGHFSLKIIFKSGSMDPVGFIRFWFGVGGGTTNYTKDFGGSFISDWLLD